MTESTAIGDNSSLEAETTLDDSEVDTQSTSSSFLVRLIGMATSYKTYKDLVKAS